MQSHHFAQVWDDTLQQLSWTVANHVVAPKVRRGGGFLVAEILHHLKFQRSLTILWDMIKLAIKWCRILGVKTLKVGKSIKSFGMPE